jgi:hypothetical protein
LQFIETKYCRSRIWIKDAASRSEPGKVNADTLAHFLDLSLGRGCLSWFCVWDYAFLVSCLGSSLGLCFSGVSGGHVQTMSTDVE